jgi:methanogenic corrinoid protein MtbC1
VRFEKTIANSTLSIGFENTVLNIIYPFLDRIGVLWLSGNINPAQEHFVSNLLRQKLLVAIDGLVVKPKPDAKRFMLFLPENEFHELGLLFYSYLVRKSGNKILYLGQSVPFDDLLEVAKYKEPDYLVSYFTASMSNEDFKAYIQKLSEVFKDKTIYISGLLVRETEFNLPFNVKKFNSALEFKQALSTIN